MRSYRSSRITSVGRSLRIAPRTLFDAELKPTSLNLGGNQSRSVSRHKARSFVLELNFKRDRKASRCSREIRAMMALDPRQANEYGMRVTEKDKSVDVARSVYRHSLARVKNLITYKYHRDAPGASRISIFTNFESRSSNLFELLRPRFTRKSAFSREGNRDESRAGEK